MLVFTVTGKCLCDLGNVSFVNTIFGTDSERLTPWLCASLLVLFTRNNAYPHMSCAKEERDSSPDDEYISCK